MASNTSCLYVCTISVCYDLKAPLGMEDGSIPRDKITASDILFQNSWNYGAKNARLDDARAWVALGSVTDPWIEADVGHLRTVSCILTQGDGGYGQTDKWVTKLKVSTKLNSDDVEGPGIFMKDNNGDDKVCMV